MLILVEPTQSYMPLALFEHVMQRNLIYEPSLTNNILSYLFFTCFIWLLN